MRKIWTLLDAIVREGTVAIHCECTKMSFGCWDEDEEGTLIIFDMEWGCNHHTVLDFKNLIESYLEIHQPDPSDLN